MKKTLCIVLAILMLTAVFMGCSKKAEDDENVVKSIELQLEDREDKTVIEEVLENKPDPLRVCVDLDFTDRVQGEMETSGLMLGVLSNISLEGGPADIVCDVLPADLPESEGARMSMMNRIRAEIMSGAGPDVFIMGTNGSYFGRMGDSMFAVPEKTMANGIFLPLDDYIENAKFMEWDKFHPVIMEAGRDAYGQQLIPMAYTFPITFFREEDVPEKFGAETTWQDMLETDNGALAAASTWYHTESFGLSEMNGHYMGYTFGALADIENETLLVTEEELLQRTNEIMEQRRKYDEGELPEAPAHYQTTLRANLDNSGSRIVGVEWSDGIDPYAGLYPNDKKTMVPIYSADGGITAQILYYTAVNANTTRPDDAFFVVDYIMSTSSQQRSSLYGRILTRTNGFPVHTELGSPQKPLIYDSVFGTWYFKQDNFEEFSRIRDQITHARFRSSLDEALDNFYYDCFRFYRNGSENGETLEDITAESYRQMEILLGE
ncbi:MAG: hypothetical protein IJF56_10415 [Clostridia bacterium]|nr:hypothetical protein [Clostridia bacterium]